MYLYCKVGMYITTTLLYSDYCNMLMLSVYKYDYYTLGIYIAVAFPYLLGRGVTKCNARVHETRIPTPIREVRVQLLAAPKRDVCVSL